MVASVYGRELRANMGVAILVSGSLACCSMIVVGMFSPETAHMLASLKQLMPEVYDAFGMGHDTSSLTGFLLNYLYGFLFTLCPLAVTAASLNRSVTRPIASGELAQVLASPHSRGSIAFSLVLSSLTLMLFTTLLSCASVVVAAEFCFPGQLDLGAMVRVNVGLFGLQLCMAGVCTLSCLAIGHIEAAAWAGTGFCVVEYLVQMVGQAGFGGLEAQPFTIFALFDPYALAMGDGQSVIAAGVLAVVGVLLGGLGIIAFSHRDLSI